MVLLLKHAWRAWKNARGVAALAVLALGIGIGSAVAIYTVVNAVLIKPLPFRHGERYVVLYATYPGADPNSMSGATYRDLTIYEQRCHSFDVFGWFAVSGDYNLTSPGQPEHIHGVEVTPSLVENLGVNPVLGRWFRDVSKEPDGAHVAVISEALWKRFGRDPNIIGKSIDLNGASYRVTGIAPSWFRIVQLGESWLGAPEDVWVPIDPHGREQDETHGYYLAYARLRRGVSLRQAGAEVRAIAAQIARDSPARHPNYTAGIRSLHEMAGQGIRPVLLLLLGASALLLLITCANVSGLLVARSVHRARDTALRVALGAGRAELAVQFFLEGLYVSIAGGVLGVLAAYVFLHLVTTFAAENIPRADEIGIDGTVLLVAVGLACFAALLASLAPLWQALHIQPNDVLSEGVRASASRQSNRISRVLVVAEIALAFTLVCSAGILSSHLDALLHLWPGFNPENLLTFQLQALGSQYPNEKSLLAYQQNLLAKLESIPGVQSAAIAWQLPLEGCCSFANIVPRDPVRPANEIGRINLNLVSAGYFTTMQMELAGGRFLNEHDTTDKPIHIVINQSAARTLWPRRNAVGALANLGAATGDPVQVVGIVQDVQYDELGRRVEPEMYMLNSFGPSNPMRIALRCSLPPRVLVPRVRAAIRQLNPAQPLYDVAMATRVVQRSLTLQHATSFLTEFFGVASLLLATLGVYGVMSYFVRQRTVELGTRMALGAVPGDLLRLVLRNSGSLAVWGIGIGALGAAFAAWLLVNRFDVPHLVWTSFAYPVLSVGAVTTVAALYPGWRASLLSPMVAIRNEPESMWRNTRQRMRELLARISPGPFTHSALLVSETTLLTEFIDAARRADSFDDALRTVLNMLCREMRTDLAVLLENRGANVYQSIAATRPDAALELPRNGFLLHRMQFYPLPLPLTEDDFATWLKWAAEQRPEYLTELAELRDAGARLAVPLRTRDEILGILLLGAKTDGDYSAGDRRVLRACAEQLALMLENGRLTLRMVEQEKLRRDVALAAEVQKRLLPESLPAIAVGEIAAYTLPARSVGGDYYDFLQAGDQRIGIAVADVAGKGVAAALITSVVHASLRILASDGAVSLPDLTAKMNRFLHRSTGSNSYATFFYAQLNERTQELKYVNAGHNPPFLLRQGGAQVEMLSEGGMMIGLFPQATYAEGTVRLACGDVLLIFTDGVPEALNPAEEEFGEARLQNLLQTVAHLPVHEMSARIAERLRTWISTADQHDDLTFVILKIERSDDTSETLSPSFSRVPDHASTPEPNQR